LRATTALAQDLGSPAISLCVDEANSRAHALYVREGFVQVRHDVAEGFYVLEKPIVAAEVRRGALS
jgi:[ribosomal protein S18]-alanine N-acetyltransferase